LLFNLATDPNETKNVITSHPKKAAELEKELKAIVAKGGARKRPESKQ
jgi:hypothetical protein